MPHCQHTRALLPAYLQAPPVSGPPPAGPPGCPVPGSAQQGAHSGGRMLVLLCPCACACACMRKGCLALSSFTCNTPLAGLSTTASPFSTTASPFSTTASPCSTPPPLLPWTSTAWLASSTPASGGWVAGWLGGWVGGWVGDSWLGVLGLLICLAGGLERATAAATSLAILLSPPGPLTQPLPACLPRPCPAPAAAWRRSLRR